MDDVATAVQDWLNQGRRVVLATVVEAHGSSPHATGAILAIEESGSLAGSIAGGCVDSSVLAGAEAVFDTGDSQLLHFDSVDGDDIIAVGLVCGGRLTVHLGLLDQVDRAFIDSVATGVAAVRCVRLDAPATGARLVFASTASGTLGATDIDAWARDRASDRLVAGSSSAEEGPYGARVFFGVSRDRPLAVIAGVNGYTAALVTVAEHCGYRVLVCDGRPRFATATTGIEGENVSPDARLQALEADNLLDDRSIVLVCTHDPRIELAALTVALRGSAGFVGAMGSRRTQEARLERLRRAGLNEHEIARLRAPVGLDIGAATPAETAVSILAEVVAHRSGRSGRPLGETAGAIHPR